MLVNDIIFNNYNKVKVYHHIKKNAKRNRKNYNSSLKKEW